VHAVATACLCLARQLHPALPPGSERAYHLKQHPCQHQLLALNPFLLTRVSAIPAVWLQVLEPSFGGNATTSLDAVVAKLTRSKAGKGYHSAREALLLNGRFVLAQVGIQGFGWVARSCLAC